MNAYLKKQYKERKAELVKRLGGTCAICKMPDREFDFDHIDPLTKSFAICKKLTSYSMEAIQKELTKCQLLCRKCHQQKTREQLGQKNARAVHGTLSSYRYCKCDLCKAAKAAYMKNYKRKDRKQ